MLRWLFDLFTPRKGKLNPYQTFSAYQEFDVHLDLHVTRQQIVSAKSVPLDVPEVGRVEIRLVPQIEDGFMMRLPELLPNKGSVIAHVHVHD